MSQRTRRNHLMRLTRSPLLILCIFVSAMLIPSQLPATVLAAAHNCGKERWDVKTVSDPAASQIRLTPLDVTVTQLQALKFPLKTWAPHSRRQPPVEFTVYRAQVRLIEYHQEPDHDFHVVVAEPTDNSKTMIVELPDPACPGASGSPMHATLSAVRQTFVDHYGHPPTGRDFSPVPGHPVVNLTGVGFFDKLHGQRGVAPNGIELHPVLSVP